MTNHKDYESWMNELEILADLNSMDINRDIYNYHKYFMSGWEPQGVIDDIRESLSMSDTI